MRTLSTLGTTLLAIVAFSAVGCVANSGDPNGEATGQATAALSGSSEQCAPFVGFLSGQDVDNASGTGATETGSGIATDLGTFTYAATWVYNANGTGDGTFVWTAANGDTLESTAYAVPGAQHGALLSLVESHTVTGGTGRFAHETGSFKVHCEVNVNTNAVDATIDGELRR